MAKSVLHGNRQWQGGARQQPACICPHILPHIPPQVHPHCPRASHLYLPHNQEAISICDFSGACTVDSEILKVSQSPRQCPPAVLTLLLSEEFLCGPISSSAWCQRDLDLWLRVKMQYGCAKVDDVVRTTMMLSALLYCPPHRPLYQQQVQCPHRSPQGCLTVNDNFCLRIYVD